MQTITYSTYRTVERASRVTVCSYYDTLVAERPCLRVISDVVIVNTLSSSVK